MGGSTLVFSFEKMTKNTYLPESVVGIVSLRITRLLQEVQNILKIAACLWSPFGAASLFKIVSKLDFQFSKFASEEARDAALDVAVTESLFDDLETGHYKFSHDRIQESALSLFKNTKQREILHLRIGEIIRTMMGT